MIDTIIKKLEQKGYSQNKIWRETGIPQSCISRYKSGKVTPHPRHVPTLVLLAESNGIKITDREFRNYVMSFK